MMHKSIEQCGGHDFVAEELCPRLETLVAGHDDRGAFVELRNEGEKEVGFVTLDRGIANLVDDHEGSAARRSTNVVPRSGRTRPNFVDWRNVTCNIEPARVVTFQNPRASVSRTLANIFRRNNANLSGVFRIS
jgi:hypothetical protein